MSGGSSESVPTILPSAICLKDRCPGASKMMGVTNEVGGAVGENAGRMAQLQGKARLGQNARCIHAGGDDQMIERHSILCGPDPGQHAVSHVRVPHLALQLDECAVPPRSLEETAASPRRIQMSIDREKKASATVPGHERRRHRKQSRRIDPTHGIGRPVHLRGTLLEGAHLRRSCSPSWYSHPRRCPTGDAGPDRDRP